ncbi:sperm-tail PG-rich repeat-containing protein 2 [Pristis pectinata]|uniref:sperm-tail PG-rich repeat-containing protein 2 n=1 Tax=Pristis pectinata TaxID=685728 RepID=UPI00223E475B|nr:sperm-tail PG-rich repeat-containing protein 2 [Pristis pectinata]
MYDRAPRDTIFASALGSTGPAVGPASYNASGSKCREGDGYAPFLSLTSRESVLIAPGALLVPGPQHYDVNPVQEHIKGGQSMKNREIRFKEVGADLPGPGSYNVHPMNLVERVNKAPKPQCTALVTNPAASAPSIPASSQSYGYEEAEDGVLSRHLLPSRDTSLGPAYYSPQYTEPYPTRQYKGVHFGNRTSKRLNFKIPLGPGPGSYDIQKESTLNYENLNMKNIDQKRESYVPRFIDAVVQEEEKKGFPGPAKYEIKGQFNEKTNVLNKYIPPHPPFLSQTKRFLPEKSITPAPGWYDDPRTALQTLKRISTKGPGTYNVTNHTLARESLKKAALESSTRIKHRDNFDVELIATDSNGNHFLLSQQPAYSNNLPTAWNSCSTSPPPGLQIIPEIREIKNNYTKHKSSSFASLTERMPAPGAQDFPAPGSYEVQKAYEKTQARGPGTSDEFTCNSFLTTVPRNFNPIRQTADEPGGVLEVQRGGDGYVKENRFQGKKWENGSDKNALRASIGSMGLKASFCVVKTYEK